ncbi:unnamed protein product [Acanthocheilonema viteae]|uniref:Uncharacterized protein n=1 Tax=Acanthocheilonema viteae TaxID=6277 RepID=A0A498SH43_ACAVI|nr:unnamed protein product [Acanthocheilonema viteae]
MTNLWQYRGWSVVEDELEVLIKLRRYMEDGPEYCSKSWVTTPGGDRRRVINQRISHLVGLLINAALMIIDYNSITVALLLTNTNSTSIFCKELNLATQLSDLSNVCA